MSNQYNYTNVDLHIDPLDLDREPAEVLHELWSNRNPVMVVRHLLEMTADRPGYGLATTAYFARKLNAEDLDIFHSLLPEDA